MPRRTAIHGMVLSLAIFVVGCGQPSGSSGPSASPTEGATAAAPSSVAPAPVAIESAMPSGIPATADRVSSELPTRIVVPKLGIDLPVVSGDVTVPGNPPDYPLCDVAQYLTTYPNPGRPGTTTWIYGHARDGMFLPLLEASATKAGASLIGQAAQLYTDGGRRYTYRITEVLRHATDRTSASGVPADGGRLILQTSEGPKGTVPKLQVVAELVDSERSTKDKSQPPAKPRGCYIP